MMITSKISKQAAISYLVGLTEMTERKVKKLMETPQGLTKLGGYIVDFLCGKPTLAEDDEANDVLTLLTEMGGGIRDNPALEG